jgi:hypothetical protein
MTILVVGAFAVLYDTETGEVLATGKIAQGQSELRDYRHSWLDARML